MYTILDSNGSRVWNVDLLKALSEDLAHKTAMFNKKIELQRALDAREKSIEIKVEQLTEKINILQTQLGDFGPGKQYDTIDISGKHHSRAIPELSDLEPFLDLRLLPYMYISKGLGNYGITYIWEIQTRGESEHKRVNSCPPSDDSWKFWKYRCQTGAVSVNGKVWRAVPGELDERKQLRYGFKKLDELSPAARDKEEEVAAQWNLTRTKLVDIIHKHADRLKDVDKIVCFALGSLHYRKSKSYVQHLAATTIRDTLYEIQKAAGQDTSIEVIAQDPAYDEQCKRILREELNIRAVADFEGFLSITKNTFIVSIAPSAPIVEVIADVTLGFGGPAAILCDEISDDYLAPESDSDGAYGSEWSTKNSVEFKSRCESEDFGDAQDLLGMIYAEHDVKWPTSPAMMPPGPEKEKCQEEWSKAVRVNFPDLKVYIRKY